MTDSEIFDTLKTFKPYRAPSSDRFRAGFFQLFWLIVGNSVKAEVKSIFISGVVLEYLNKTLITLIPKCKSPESLNNYCSISLCNIIYKLVTKIIVGRIKHMLPSLVSSLQTAFVLGRKRVDNSAIV